ISNDLFTAHRRGDGARCFLLRRDRHHFYHSHFLGADQLRGFPARLPAARRRWFMPSFFAERGRRLVFSSGIIALAVLAGLLIIAFGGVTDALIPLFAIGAFSAFSLSQIGMVAHWRRKRGKHARTKLAVNAAGGTMTSIALT